MMKEIFIDEVNPDIIDKEFLSKVWTSVKYEINFLFKSDFSNAKYLRDFLSNILDIVWVEKTWKNRFVLIADEMNNNAIEYWSKNWEINSFRFVSEKINDEISIKIEVEDSWKWEKAKNSKEMEVLRDQRLKKWFQDHDSIRWRWLFLIIT